MFPRPRELDGYVAPPEPIMEAVIGRRPVPGEWLNYMRPRQKVTPPSQDGTLRLGRVVTIVDGGYNEGGCVVLEWDRQEQAFTSDTMIPWSCIQSRASVTRYSLTGEL